MHVDTKRQTFKLIYSTVCPSTIEHVNGNLHATIGCEFPGHEFYLKAGTLTRFRANRFSVFKLFYNDWSLCLHVTSHKPVIKITSNIPVAFHKSFHVIQLNKEYRRIYNVKLRCRFCGNEVSRGRHLVDQLTPYFSVKSTHRLSIGAQH